MGRHLLPESDRANAGFSIQNNGLDRKVPDTPAPSPALIWMVSPAQRHSKVVHSDGDERGEATMMAGYSGSTVSNARDDGRGGR